MQLPGPIRAAVGFVASATDEAKHLPDRAIELPMLAVSTALQLSLRAQQRYARLTVRGDAVLSRSRPSTEPPPWATFDDPVSIEELRRDVRDDTEGIGAESSRLLQDIFGVEDPTSSEADTSAEPSDQDAGRPTAASKAPATKATKKAIKKAAPAAKKAAAKKAAAKKAPAKKAAAKKAPANKAVPRQAVPTAEDTTDSTPAAANGKAVSKPRHIAPSAFDNVSDDE